jgi:hypothetical protein
MTLPALEDGKSLMLIPITIDKTTGVWYQTIKQLPADGDFLCRRGQGVWTSYVRVNDNPDATMPRNCREGCMYVQPRYDGPVIPVDQLDEIYYICQEPPDGMVALVDA